MPTTFCSGGVYLGPMRRTFVIALVVLLALLGPGLAFGSSHGPADGTPAVGDAPADGTSGVQAANNTTARLDLPGGATAAYGVPSLDFGATVATVDTDLSLRYDVQRVVVVFGSIPAEARAAVAQEELGAIEHRLDALREREREAVRQYHAGELTRQGLLRELARIDTEAESLQRSLRALSELDSEVPGYSIEGTADDLRSQLDLLQGPVRERVDEAFVGDNEPPTVRIRTADIGVVLETVDGGRYVREAVRFDKVNRSVPDSLNTIGEVEDRMETLYPWAMAESEQVNFGSPSDGLYVVYVEHPQGDLTVYLDGGTGEVFREVQRLDLSTLPRQSVATSTGNGLAVDVERTVKGGPLRINVTEASSGAPVDATVVVGNTTLGRTGDDGTLWAVEPTGVYRLRVVDDARSTNVTVTS